MPAEVVFPFRKDGVDCGFLAEPGPEFIFKPDRCSAAIIPLEKLKKNLRLLVKEKQARVIKAGSAEAVAVPRDIMWKLFR